MHVWYVEGGTKESPVHNKKQSTVLDLYYTKSAPSQMDMEVGTPLYRETKQQIQHPALAAYGLKNTQKWGVCIHWTDDL